MSVTVTPGNGGKYLALALKQIETKIGKVGWLKGDQYPTENGKTGPFVAQIAAQNEMGDPSQHIPARPFIQPTIDQQRDAWGKISADGAKAIFEGRSTVVSLMDTLGAKIREDIKESISKLQSPALAPSTIARRIAKSGLSQKKKNNLTSKILSRQELTSGEQHAVGGLTKPLIDTSKMYSSCINSVEDA